MSKFYFREGDCVVFPQGGRAGIVTRVERQSDGVSMEEFVQVALDGLVRRFRAVDLRAMADRVPLSEVPVAPRQWDTVLVPEPRGKDSWGEPFQGTVYRDEGETILVRNDATGEFADVPSDRLRVLRITASAVLDHLIPDVAADGRLEVLCRFLDESIMAEGLLRYLAAQRAEREDEGVERDDPPRLLSGDYGAHFVCASRGEPST